MDSKNSKLLIVLFVIVVIIFLFFGGWGMSGGMMHNGMNRNGWMGDHSWTLFPTLFTLVVGVILGWAIFKKKE